MRNHSEETILRDHSEEPISYNIRSFVVTSRIGRESVNRRLGNSSHYPWKIVSGTVYGSLTLSSVLLLNMNGDFIVIRIPLDVI